MRHRRWCWVFFAGWLVAAEVVAAAEPHQPTGQLLYSRLTDGTWQIWETDLATSERLQVTFTAGDKHYPSWAPDGTVTYCTSNQACFRSQIGDQASDLLLKDLWPLRDVVWSPDKLHMAFSRFRTDLVDSANLWIADASGKERQMLTHDVGIQEHPAWSPDGKWIAYSGGHGYKTYEIYVVSADGTEQRQLTHNESHEFVPAWSPGGTRIAFSSDASGNYDIWVMNADGSNLRQLTDDPALDTRPAWSPDGSQIAFATNRSGTLELWVMQADGTGQQLLEQAEGGVCDPAWR